MEHREPGNADQLHELRAKWAALCIASDEFRACFERHFGASNTAGLYLGDSSPSPPNPAPAPPVGALKSSGALGPANWFLGPLAGLGGALPEPASPGMPGASAGGGGVQPPSQHPTTDCEALEIRVANGMLAVMNDMNAKSKPCMDQFTNPYANRYQLTSQMIQICADAIARYEAFRPDAKALAASGRGAVLKQLEVSIADCKQALATYRAMIGQQAAANNANTMTMWKAQSDAVRSMQDTQRRNADIITQSIEKFKI
jgi:hypothetical protein